MHRTLRIALIGDYDRGITAHVAIPQALALAGKTIQCAVEPTWIATHRLEQDAAEPLSKVHGVWCVPGSPYQSMSGALQAIRFARERPRPFLGTCGGFQHALIEYARHVLGLAEADHAESNPNATLPLIGALACPLREAAGSIALRNPSRLHTIYGSEEAMEGYNCSFGLNPKFRALLNGRGLEVTGTDTHGDVRAVELTTHPFFIATLFQPERSALQGLVHPLVVAFLEAARDGGNPS